MEGGSQTNLFSIQGQARESSHWNSLYHQVRVSLILPEDFYFHRAQNLLFDSSYAQVHGLINDTKILILLWMQFAYREKKA